MRFDNTWLERREPTFYQVNYGKRTDKEMERNISFIEVKTHSLMHLLAGWD